MTEVKQVRINDLARELEVKAKAVLEYLPEIGVTEKKTHSSSIDVEHAEQVRKHFSGGPEEPAKEAPAPPQVAVEEPKQPEKPVLSVKAPAAVASAPAPASAPAANSAPATAAPPPTTVKAPPAAGAPIFARPKPPATAVPPVPPKPPISAGPAPSGTAIVQRPAAAGTPAPAMPSRPSGTPAPSSAKFPPRHAGPSAPAAASPATQGAPIRRPSQPPPGAGRRPGGPGGQSGTPSGAGGQSFRPRGVQPKLPSRPIETTRLGAPPKLDERRPQRPGAPRPGGGPTGRRMGQGAPEAGAIAQVPGKKEPLYRRPTPARERPSLDKRFEEGERRLHPVRTAAAGDKRSQARAKVPVAPVVREPRNITITEGITVRELAEKMDVRAKEFLKKLMDRGILASINQALDTNTAKSLAEEFNGVVEVVTYEENLILEEASKEVQTGKQEPRAPVVTVMGHVDHGKTSLLDSIREANVAEGESGGITQHIGAYQVETKGKRIVFIDTPGHEAFTRMRARGAKVTDIVILVVAADDGIMPQTDEAIDHARAAKVPIIVAVNKIDKAEAQPERVKRQLADRGLVPEDWGGDTVTVEVSAKTKKNLDHLLEMILLVADLRELKANPEAAASGTVLESRIDRGRGPVATVLVQNGTLHVGDSFICGAVYGKVRALFDDRGNSVKEAGPSSPVEVLGLQGLPDAGDQLLVTEESEARHIVEYRQAKQREAALATTGPARITLDQLHEQLKSGEVKELPVVIKADVQGSVEVLSELLPKLSTDQVKLKIIHASVGAVTETDVLLASASKAIVLSFNVRPERKASDLARQEGVDIRTHTIIYELVDELKKALAGLLTPEEKEVQLGHAEVRDTFRIKGVGMIAGCYIQDGLVKRDASVRVLRDNKVIYTGRVTSLRRFKEDVSEVRAGFECGITVSNFSDVKVGDVLEVFTVEKMAPVEAAV